MFNLWHWILAWAPIKDPSIFLPFQKQMEELLSFSKKSSQSNHSIWFGHFTTSTILSPSPGIRTVMRWGRPLDLNWFFSVVSHCWTHLLFWRGFLINLACSLSLFIYSVYFSLFSSATAYLCGHLHTLGGLMPVLHTRHFTGTLELEVGDWKDNRR